MCKFLVIFIISISSCYAQNSVVSWDYYEINDRFGVVELAHENADTSVIVGLIEHSNDTIFFHELEDSIVVQIQRAGGIYHDNVGVTRLSTSKSYLLDGEGLYARFQYLGNPHEIVLMDSFHFVVNDSIYLPATVLEEDTVYFSESNDRYHHFIRVEGSHMRSTDVNVYNPENIHGRRRKRREEPIDRPLSRELVLDAYFSINPLEIDVKSVIGDTIALGHKTYAIIYRNF